MEIQNELNRCTGGVPNWDVWDVPGGVPIVYCIRQKSGKFWGHCRNISGKLKNWGMSGPLYPGHYQALSGPRTEDALS